MPDLRIEGYVIVSAEGMLANAARVMPDELKFEGDKKFFTAALDRADLIVHGRHSYEGQPNSPQRKRIIVTRRIAATRARSVQPESHAVESGRGFVRSRVRFRRRAFRRRCGHRRTRRVRDVHGPLRYVLAFAGAPGATAGWRTVLPRRARKVSAANSGGTWPYRDEAESWTAPAEVTVTPWRRRA